VKSAVVLTLHAPIDAAFNDRLGRIRSDSSQTPGNVGSATLIASDHGAAGFNRLTPTAPPPRSPLTPGSVQTAVECDADARKADGGEASPIVAASSGGARGSSAGALARLTALTKEMTSLRETAQAARTILKLRNALPEEFFGAAAGVVRW
jgi:hypothetical protein